MKKAVARTAAGQQYAMAHAAHYTTKDLHEALRLYRDVMSAHPDAEEAKYSRSQIQNIVSVVVPKEALFDAQWELALVHAVSGSQPGVATYPAEQPVADSPAEVT
jgi:hypothetical protein